MSILRPLPARSRSTCRRACGFALIEVLIAAAIAAAVLVACANALSSSVRSAKAVTEAHAALRQAETIAARLKAGAPVDDLLDEDWTLTRTRLPSGNSNRGATYLEDIHVIRDTNPKIEFHVYVVRKAAP
ncbi:MAG: prepilin-type N-terminal cleavage/methylation domain-containing protein [Pseudomonadota bacterium]